MRHIFYASALSAVFFIPAVAQDSWKLDKSHANIGFTVTHMVISEVPGGFKDFDIEFKASKEDFSDASISATIQTASIDTRNERRDGHLKSDDFFNAELFPTITFVSRSFERMGEKPGEQTFRIHGDLTIRDVTKPVVFDARLIGVVKTQRGTMSGWKATTSIDRFDYNLKWDRALETGGLIVGRTVDITLNAEFSRQSASTIQ